MIENAKDSKNVSGKFLDSFIWTVENKVGHPPSKTLKPSSLRCIRNSVYQCLGVPMQSKKTSHILDGICVAGTSIHEYIQSICCIMKKTGWEFIDVGDYIRAKKLDIQIIKESDFTKGIFETKLKCSRFGSPISFLCDGILKYKDKFYILEIKSTNAGSFFKQIDVEQKHKVQAIAYSVLLDIDTVLFLYVERDLLNKKCFQFIPSSQDKVKFRQDMSLITRCIKFRTIPSKPAEAYNDKNFCRYCNYVDECNCNEESYKYIERSKDYESKD